MNLIYESNGYKIYSQFDRTAEVYELFTDTDGVGYVGCADSIREAKQIAKDFVEEQ